MPWLASKREIAEYCGVSERKLDEWIEKYKNFPVMIEKNGAKWKTLSDDLDNWLRKQYNHNPNV